ncbi:acetylornithine aminotransferase/acetylornithine/N-succinyldiaminopimelate aminotransferase [Persephonella hydrogeniphila]|uniref:Acetylornithine aminotransferase n=1 Tax=Persephonella hydrogeniphila TaxID=198703 RepID=A0A285NFD2_9AQUI|nr:aspartate aminotransferase family protein [Persephonella hydrogeniphila]SNZ06606.1 acetylornithine aminotransferase/acetylornithine/N-succinyldiaminopimelate aminotransferase [Persephonella hydrogeniphila]
MEEFISEGEKYLIGNYARYPVSFEKGEGVYLYDSNGKRYIDMLAGIAVNTLGYSHPELTKAICEQASKILHVSNLFYIQPQIEVAKILVENTCLDRVFFCNSGAEANEAAIKLVRKYFYDRGKPEKFEIITFTGGFHGRTIGSLTATAQPKYHEGFKPLLQGIRYAEFNNVESFRKAVNENTAAVMFEFIQGEGGINPIDEEFLEEIKNISIEKELLIVVDEVQTGIGRTGKLFAYQHYNICPDIVTVAKGLGGGVPIGAVIAKEEIAKSFTPGTHGSTFGGNYLSTTAAKVVLKNVLSDGFLKEVERKGKILEEELRDIGLKPRGKGLMIGTPLPEGIKAQDIAKECLRRGLVIGTAGGNTLRFVPPLIITESQIKEGIEILKEVVKGL